LSGGYGSFFNGLTSEVAINGYRKEVVGLQGYNIMLVQIYMDFSCLPSLKDITLDQIEFFYNPLIEGLLKAQKTK
jgi:hypothetical protein